MLCNEHCSQWQLQKKNEYKLFQLEKKKKRPFPGCFRTWHTGSPADTGTFFLAAVSDVKQLSHVVKDFLWKSCSRREESAPSNVMYLLMLLRLQGISWCLSCRILCPLKLWAGFQLGMLTQLGCTSLPLSPGVLIQNSHYSEPLWSREGTYHGCERCQA